MNSQHNKSFKTRNIKNISTFNKNKFQLVSKLDNNIIKIIRSKTKNDIFVDDNKIKNTSSLSYLLPIQLISPDKGFIIGSEPKNRRYYLDWGMFHVEHNLLNDYKNNVKQFVIENGFIKDMV